METFITTSEIKKAAESLVGMSVPWEEAVKLMKRAVIDRALEETNGNQCKAARLLKVHRNTISRIMKDRT